jgi:phage-related protein
MSDYVEAFGVSLPSRLNAQAIERRHGVYLADVPVLDGCTLRMKGVVIGSSIDDARSKLQAIAEIVHYSGEQKFYYWSDRFWVVAKSQWTYEPIPGSAGLCYVFELELLCADPYLYEDTSQSDTETTTGAAKSFTVTNDGTMDQYLRITFTADQGNAITTISLKNNTTTKTFGYGGTIAIGKALVVNPADTTVKNNGTEDLTNVSGSIMLWIQPGANSLTYTGSACTILSEWRNRWAI